MTATMGQVLEAARQQAGLTNRDLWIAYCSIGGSGDPTTLAAYLAGAVVPSDTEYDVVAQALNDAFVTVGGDHPVPYAEDLRV